MQKPPVRVTATRPAWKPMRRDTEIPGTRKALPKSAGNSDTKWPPPAGNPRAMASSSGSKSAGNPAPKTRRPGRIMVDTSVDNTPVDRRICWCGGSLSAACLGNRRRARAGAIWRTAAKRTIMSEVGARLPGCPIARGGGGAVQIAQRHPHDDDHGGAGQVVPQKGDQAS